MNTPPTVILARALFVLCGLLMANPARADLILIDFNLFAGNFAGSAQEGNWSEFQASPDVLEDLTITTEGGWFGAADARLYDSYLARLYADSTIASYARNGSGVFRSNRPITRIRAGGLFALENLELNPVYGRDPGYAITFTGLREGQVVGSFDVTVGGDDEDALDVNVHGQAVGFSLRPDGTVWGLLWTYGSGQMLAVNAIARTINGNGDSAGWSLTAVPTPDGSSETLFAPTAWRSGVQQLLIAAKGEALDINDSGKIVGEYWTDLTTLDGQSAFYFDGTNLFNLFELVVNPHPFRLFFEARGINNQGHIVGAGYVGDELRGFLLTPVK